MGFNPEYQSLFDKTKQLRFQIHDALDDPNHSSARLLTHELQQLEDDIQLKKRPRDIQNRLKTIEHTLRQAKNQPKSFISPNDAQKFHHSYEQMTHAMHDFKDYS